VDQAAAAVGWRGCKGGRRGRGRRRRKGRARKFEMRGPTGRT
jgi:hypothetical protein